MAAYGRGIHNTIMNRAIDPRAKAEGNHDEPPQPPLDLRSPRRRGARVRTGAPPITLTIGGVVDDFSDLRDADFPASEMIRDEEPGWLLRSLKQGA